MTPSPDQLAQVSRERSIELAEQDLPAIESLLDSKGWAYLSRRLNERRQQLRDKIADDEGLSDEHTRILRARAKEYEDILRLPHQDRTIHTNTLRARDKFHSGPSRG